MKPTITLSRGECYLDAKMKSIGLYPLGNAYTDDILAMWYHPQLDSLRQHYSPDKYSFISKSEFEGAGE